MAQKCVHKGCGRTFTDPDEPCVYHPGPPQFHEGQKGWMCCKPRVLTFDEFLSIPPCTTGKHSTVDDTPAPPETKPAPTEDLPTRAPVTVSVPPAREAARAPQPAAPPPEPPAPEPETEDDDPSVAVPANASCRRRGCGKKLDGPPPSSREGEECIYHSGNPIFHEGSKGWTCCKRKVLEFDEFLRIEGCQRKDRHLFVGSGKPKQKKVDNVRHDFYQTGNTVHASLYLKKISKSDASVVFSSPTTVDLDLPTADSTRYKTTLPLYGPIDVEKSTFKILGTKLELTLAKADGLSWPVLRSDEKRTGEIIQVGKAGTA